MPRPRKDDSRKHQINIRFTTHELARVHTHAGLIGKTPADFARSVMLRRPRRRKGELPVMITVGERALRRWHATGLELNVVAHRFNATGEMPGIEFERLHRALGRLLGASFPAAFPADRGSAAYALAPALRYHLRKTCTNLVQIADRFRAILIGDRPPHGA